MPNTQKHNLADSQNLTVNIAELISQYDVTQMKLHQCAMYEADDNLARNTEMADNEYLYLSKQEEILSQAAATSLKTEEDVQNILRLWMKERAEYEDMASADQLIMSVCHYFDVVA